MSDATQSVYCLPRPRHIPVMVDEVLEYLAPSRGQLIVDATVGAGGHSSRIAERLGSDGLLVGIDCDPNMIEIARSCIFGSRTAFASLNFADLNKVLVQFGIDAIDGLLIDLGLASDQIDDAERGFSFSKSGPLDMRMDQRQGEPAAHLVNHMKRDKLAELFFRFGEERYSRRIARTIIAAREQKPIETTEELAQLVRRAIPRSRSRWRIDPATRVFQALRIAVNKELVSLEQCLAALPECIKPGGRAVIISFHSLEDRLVKGAFRQRASWEPLVRKPVRPSQDEVARNPRARSAKLRAARLL